MARLVLPYGSSARIDLCCSCDSSFTILHVSFRFVWLFVFVEIQIWICEPADMYSNPFSRPKNKVWIL
ncbi:unnamed protein product [Rhodiola kirilowii]